MMTAISTVVLDFLSLPTRFIRVAFSRPQAWFGLVGLLTDFVGALYLIIPDVHLFRISAPEIRGSRPWPRTGRLAEARSQLRTGVLRPRDDGFQEFTDLLSDIKSEHNYPNADSREAVKIVTDRRSETPEGASKDTLDWRQEHLEVHFDEAGNWHKTIFYDYTAVQRTIDNAIKRWERRWRFTGITTLATGFVIQMLGTIIG